MPFAGGSVQVAHRVALGDLLEGAAAVGPRDDVDLHADVVRGGLPGELHSSGRCLRRQSGHLPGRLPVRAAIDHQVVDGELHPGLRIRRAVEPQLVIPRGRAHVALRAGVVAAAVQAVEDRRPPAVAEVAIGVGRGIVAAGGVVDVHAHGGQVAALHEQGHFQVLRAVDGQGQSRGRPAFLARHAEGLAADRVAVETDLAAAAALPAFQTLVEVHLLIHDHAAGRLAPLSRNLRPPCCPTGSKRPPAARSSYGSPLSC